MNNHQKTVNDNKPAKRRSEFSNFFLRLVKEHPLGMVGAGITLILILTGIFANLLAPYDPGQMNLMIRLSPSSPQHLLGTDQLGRDELSRIIYGARITLIVGLGATSLAAILATLIGIYSGFVGGTSDLLIQRFVDAWMSFPSLLLLMTIMSLVGSGFLQITLVLGVLFGVGSSRMIRGAVIGIKENIYIEASRSIGSTTLGSLTRHILPNIMPMIIILFSVSIGSIILTEATLSFIGYGIPVGTPSWGGMLSWEGRNFMESNPNLAIWPGLSLAIVIYGLNMLGDAIRDIFDPKLRGGVGRYKMVNVKKLQLNIQTKTVPRTGVKKAD